MHHCPDLPSCGLAAVPPPLPRHAATFNSCLAAVAKGSAAIPAIQHDYVATRCLQARAWAWVLALQEAPSRLDQPPPSGP